MTNRVFRVGTRGSRLALVQTQEVIERLKTLDSTLAFEIVPIKTKGDLKPNVALTKLGSNGLFVREVEAALLNGTIDFAVHSAKDLPAKLAPELTICATPPRALVYDVLVLKDPTIQTLAQLPKGATIATGSPRRVSLMTQFRPDLQFQGIRGNVPTRLHKLETLALDGLILAAAGLQRLDLLQDRSLHYLKLQPEKFIPAPGQGILALEVNQNNMQVKTLLQRINDVQTYQALLCERAFLQTLDGDCTIPLGCYSTISAKHTTTATAFLGDKTDRYRGQTAQANGSDPKQLGIRLAQDLRQNLAIS